jgi:hypothetical protein
MIALAAALLLGAPGAARAGGAHKMKTAAKSKAASAPRSAPAKKSSPPSAAAKERTPSAASSESRSGSSGSSSSSGGDSSDSDGDAPASSAPAAGGKKVVSKTYTFGAMDVEGKLKTPQLLYFLNRVKLELDMSAPDKRSFMKELQQSADDKNL